MMNLTSIRQKKIAVIGSGVAGISCAWLLSRAHRVTLFEKNGYLGGHANTVTVNNTDIDTGFIVYNPVNYPNFVALLDHLNVESCDTEMSFAVSIDQGKIEYSGSGLSGLFCQPTNLLRPQFIGMVKDILRFYENSSKYLNDPTLAYLPLQTLLQQEGYGQAFVEHHLLPMAAAIWSSPADKMLQYPALAFLRFCDNHGLVQLKDRPPWRTLVGGSRSYISALADKIGSSHIHLNSHIHRVHRSQTGVVLEDLHGHKQSFDHVVFACHADQALQMLAQPTAVERKLLGSFHYQRNQAILHTDAKLMPQRKRAWSSWNYLSNRQTFSANKLSVSYWMNRLQPLNSDTNYFVTLNPEQQPAEGAILRSFLYDHPTFDLASFEAQQQLWSLQGQQNSWFCGAYFGYGFHEDGLQSGLAVAEQLGGIPRPWSLENPNHRIHTDTTFPQLSRKAG